LEQPVFNTPVTYDTNGNTLTCVVDGPGPNLLRSLSYCLENRPLFIQRNGLATSFAYPCVIVSDDGTELTTNAIFGWQQERLVEWHYIAPCKQSLAAQGCRMALSKASTADYAMNA
jgi:hypothetical protein